MQLIIIRGPAGSGKSSVARELHDTATEKTALLSQDLFRIHIANLQEGAPQITADIIKYATKKFLDANYVVILEGIFNVKRDYYRDLFSDLLDYNQGSSHIYFLEISIEESIKRNAARSKGKIINEDAMREWYPKAQKSGYELERSIDVEKLSLPDTINQIAQECNLNLDKNNHKKNIKPSI